MMDMMIKPSAESSVWVLNKPNFKGKQNNISIRSPNMNTLPFLGLRRVLWTEKGIEGTEGKISWHPRPWTDVGLTLPAAGLTSVHREERGRTRERYSGWRADTRRRVCMRGRVRIHRSVSVQFIFNIQFLKLNDVSQMDRVNLNDATNSAHSLSTEQEQNGSPQDRSCLNNSDMEHHGIIPSSLHPLGFSCPHMHIHSCTLKHFSYSCRWGETHAAWVQSAI